MQKNEQKELLLIKQNNDATLNSLQESEYQVLINLIQSKKSLLNELQTDEKLNVKRMSQELLTNHQIIHQQKFINLTKTHVKLNKKVKNAFIQKKNISQKSISTKQDEKLIEIDNFSQIAIGSDIHQNKISNCQPHILMLKHRRAYHLKKKIRKQQKYLKQGSKQKDNKQDQNNVNKIFQLQKKPKEAKDQETSHSKKFVSYPSTETFISEDLDLSNQKYFQQKQYYMYNLVGHLEGQLTDTFQSQMYLRHFLQIYENLQKSKKIQISLTFSISQKIKAQTKKQKTLVIDLDETLVHCNEYPQLKSDFYIPVKVNNLIYQAGISIRPYTQEFLKNMAQYYEIIIFTASNEEYANQIINYLDPQGIIISGRLFRENCIEIEPGCHIKDLRILNRDLKDVVLIDNSAFSYAFQIENGIPIIPYLDNKKDNELQHLESYLKVLIKYDDFRKINTKLFNLQVIQNCNSIQDAIRQIISNSNSQFFLNDSMNYLYN
ncbi:unnamed protein product [Paramecium sonneborni]|uniref:FCP1 homology domain-containing protein n=1 Tax=Paramecium sonneborni TaxID=65129 RepID=A0A8S1P0K4_9CILI|nr:unnamed protein product [Paramecium sonneborni]